jgi:hypothetical protein
MVMIGSFPGDRLDNKGRVVEVFTAEQLTRLVAL